MIAIGTARFRQVRVGEFQRRAADMTWHVYITDNGETGENFDFVWSAGSEDDWDGGRHRTIEDAARAIQDEIDRRGDTSRRLPHVEAWRSCGGDEPDLLTVAIDGRLTINELLLDRDDADGLAAATIAGVVRGLGARCTVSLGIGRHGDWPPVGHGLTLDCAPGWMALAVLNAVESADTAWRLAGLHSEGRL